MSILRPAAKIFNQLSKFQQLAPISTTADLFASCDKKPAAAGSAKCEPIKGVGCAPRARPDCTPVPRERMVCHRLEVPEPSYAECLKEPGPVHGMSECTVPKLPPAHCIKPNLGKSIDGCNPPPRPSLGDCRPRNTKAPPKEKTCDPKDICDPDLKPFKSAGPSTNSAISCPSPMSSRICEPTSSSPFSTPFRNYSTEHCKALEKPKKPCFEPKKIKPKEKTAAELGSPVSCVAKGIKGNKCEQAKCGPSFTPCDKPRPINQHQCPKRIKKPRMATSTVVVKKRKFKMGYKVCTEPPALRKFSCQKRTEGKKAIERPPPTPTRCPCWKPQDLNAPKVGVFCSKMPGAVEPDCNKKGGKAKSVCQKEACANK